MKKNNNKFILLDYDQSDLRFIVIEKTKTKQIIVDEIEINTHQNLEEGLQKVKSYFRQKINCGIALPNSLTMIKKLQLKNKISAKDVKNYIELNSQKYFQCSHRRIVYDYEQIENFTDGQSIALRIIAAKKSLIRNFTHLFDKYDLKIILIDVEILVAERLFSICWAEKDYPCIVFVFRYKRILQILFLDATASVFQEIELSDSTDQSEVLAILQRFFRLQSEQYPGIEKVIFCPGNSFCHDLALKFAQDNGIVSFLLNIDKTLLTRDFILKENLSLHAKYSFCYGLLLRNIHCD